MDEHLDRTGDLSIAGIDFSEGSTFALQREEGIVIVDPPGLEGVGALFARLDELGGTSEQIQGILLTAVSPQNLECARETRRRTGALVARPSGGLPADAGETIVTGGEALTISGFRFQVQATPAPARDAVSYLVPIGEQLAAFTGDSVWAPASEPFLEQYAPAPPAVLRGILENADDVWLRRWLTSFDVLAREPVTLWLPRHQNRTLRIGRRLENRERRNPLAQRIAPADQRRGDRQAARDF